MGPGRKRQSVHSLTELEREFLKRIPVRKRDISKALGIGLHTLEALLDAGGTATEPVITKVRDKLKEMGFTA